MNRNAEPTPTLAEALAAHQGDWMRKALVYRGVSAKAMAEYLDVDAATVSRWMNGHQPPSKQTLRLWALRTGVPLGYLETGVIPDNFDPSTQPPVNDLLLNAHDSVTDAPATITNLADWRAQRVAS